MNQCRLDIKKILGEDLSEEEIDQLLSALRAKKKYYQSVKGVADHDEAARLAAEDLGQELTAEAVIKKRNSMLDYMKRRQLNDWREMYHEDRPDEALETLLVGSNRAIEGSRASVDQTQRMLISTYTSQFYKDLHTSGVLDIFTTGKMDPEIARALWSLDTVAESELKKVIQQDAIDVAKIMKKWGEHARLEANKEGSWIGKLNDYIVRQSHDMLQISNAGQRQWADDVSRLFDFKKMMQKENPNDAEIRSLINGLYLNLSSGNHLKYQAKNNGSSFTVGDNRAAIRAEIDKFETTSSIPSYKNVASKLSKERTIFFKNADAWYEYNMKYGVGNVREAYVGSLIRMAKNTGLMKILGTRPEAALNSLSESAIEGIKKKSLALIDDGNIEGSQKLIERIRRFDERRNIRDNYLAAVDGSASIPANAMAAQVGSFVRSLQTISKLGGMVLSQLADIAVFATGMRHHGRSFLGGVKDSVTGLGRNLSTKDNRSLLLSLGVVTESLSGKLSQDMVGLGNEVGVSSKWYSMSNLVRLHMKLNLSNYWTDHMRASGALNLSNILASYADVPHGKLPNDLQRTLGTYGIDSTLWSFMGKHASKEADGRSYLIPENMRNMSDADALVLDQYLQGKKGVPVRGGSRAYLEDLLRNYYVDNIGFLALEPDTKTRAMLYGGTRPGTIMGEAARFIFQFKTFSAAYLQKAIGRELYGRGYDGDQWYKALFNGNGEMQALASLMVTTTAMGYMSMMLKDLVKEKTPRNILDPTQTSKVLLAAMVQGGGAGIYGDFLFGEASRMGGGTVETLAGPTISSAGRIIDLYQKFRQGDDVKANALNQAMANTPFLNLFYSRIALNHLFLYRMQEALNPGYLARMERRIKKENNQEFLIRPSSVVR